MSTLNIEEAGRGRFRCTDEDGRVFVLTGRELKHAGVPASEGTAPVEDGAYAELLDYLYRKALARCGNLLSGMDYPVRKLEEKLARDGYPSDIAGRVISELLAAGYLDDSRYAVNFAASRLRTKSLARIRMELKEKGIAADSIEEAVLKAADLASGGADPGELETAQIRAYLAKKRYDPENTGFEERQKLMAALYRRGYSTERIREAMETSPGARDKD